MVGMLKAENFLNENFKRLISSERDRFNSKDDLYNKPQMTQLKMNLNESAYPPSPYVINKMKEACEQVFRYPDANWHELTKSLSAYVGMPENRIVLGGGSDEIIGSAGRVVLSPNTEVIAPIPSFPSYYKTAIANGAKLIQVPVRPDGSNDIDNMLSKITSATRLFFVATPNNPTGNVISTKDIERLIEGVPNTALLILDEAYYEFANQAGGSCHLNIMKRRKGPWAVLRTFSKAFGLAGLRVGYVMCGSEPVYKAFQVARSTFNVNFIAQVAAKAALQDLEHMRKIVKASLNECRRLRDGFITLGCRPYQSVANFVMAETPLLADTIVSQLAHQNILISKINAPGFDRYIRVTVGTKNETAKFLKELGKIINHA